MFITKAVLLAISVAIIILSVGCQEENLPSEKKSRIIAAENMKLKKELEQRDETIERLKKQHEEQIQQQKELLAECLKQKGTLEKQLQQNVKEQIDEVLANVIEENAKLRDQIKKLKAHIEKIEAELEARKIAPQPQISQMHIKWISECIMRIQTIKKGTTREELLRVFTTEGGWSTRLERTYVYKECPYIKVRVHFKAVDDDKFFENNKDIITDISKPYLEWMIAD